MGCGYYNRALIWCSALNQPCHGKPLKGCPVQTKERKMKEKKKTKKVVGNPTYHRRVAEGKCGRCGGVNTSKFKTCAKCRRKNKQKRGGKSPVDNRPQVATIKSTYGKFTVPIKGDVEVVVRGATLKVKARG